VKKNNISRATLWAIILLGVAISIGHQAQRNFPLVTVWDVYGYYVYLPAAITYNDVEQFRFVEDHFAEYPMQSGIFQLMDVQKGRIPIYTNGLALIWSPFYLIAEGVATGTHWKRDGMSAPYQMSLILASLFYIAISLIFLRIFLLRYFDDITVAVSLAAMVLGTNLFHYWLLSPGMPHAYVFAGHALVLYCTDSWFRRQRFIYAASGAAIIAIMCLIRPTEAIMVMLPLGYAFAKRHQFEWKSSHIYQIIGATLIAALLVVPQILIWLQNTGDWVFNAYTEVGHRFYFDGRFVLDGLLSYRKGWLLYTPLVVLAFFGLFVAKGNIKKWLIPVGLVILLHTYITFSWHWWWYANSFGSRPMVHIYPELSIGLAAFITYFGNNVKSRVALTSVLSLLIGLNLFQIWQFNNKVLPGDGITKYYYWKAFGKTEMPRHELKYLFIPHLKNKQSFERRLFIAKSISDTSDLMVPKQFVRKMGFGAQRITEGMRYSEGISITLDEETAKLLNGSWMEMYADLYIESQDFNSSKNAQFILEAKRNGERLFWQNLNFQIYTETGSWVREAWEYKSPVRLAEGDRISAYIWNKQSPDTIYLHHLAVDILSR